MGYENARIGVDAAIFTIYGRSLMVLLHKREKEPFKGKLELPGGLLKGDETAEEVVKRKIEQMFGFKDIYSQQFFTFTKPDRDPRERTVSVSFIALVDCDKLGNMDDWYDYEKLELAFDHKEILEKARLFLKENISSLIVKQFLPEEFPLNKLQEAYEIIEEIEYDNRNFRKKMISSGVVEETDKLETNVSHRPAKLFKFK